MNCVICDKPIEPTTKYGQPRKFCSARCSLVDKNRRQSARHTERMRTDPQYAKEYREKRKKYKYDVPVHGKKCIDCGADITTKWGLCDTCLEKKKSKRKNSNKVGFPKKDAKHYRDAVEHFGKCVYCGGAIEEKDHFIPKSKGGGMYGNIVPACAKCNQDKLDTLPLDWLVNQEHGLAKYAKIISFLWKDENDKYIYAE